LASQEVYQKDDEERVTDEIIDESPDLSEPKIGCRHPIIASGATPIGSAGRAPDRKLIKRKNIFTQVEDYRCTRRNFEPILE
jgi:hypothetical protein